MVARRGGRASPVASVVDCRSIAGPDCHSVGVEKVDIGGNSGPRFVWGRSTHDVDDPMVRQPRN